MTSKCLPSFLPVERYTRPRLPSSGSLGSHFPTFTGTIPKKRGTLCSATTTICSSRCPPLSLGHRYLACPVCSCPVSGSSTLRNSCADAWPAWSPGTPFPALLTRKHLVLPSSQATLLNSCPALRPRWSPQHLPYRTQDCCLPLQLTTSAFPLSCLRLSTVHNYTIFEALSHGLFSCSPRLQTSVTGFTCEVHYCPAG